MLRTKDDRFIMNSFILKIAQSVWIFFHDNISFSLSEEKINYSTSHEVLPQINCNHLGEIFDKK